MVPDRKRKRSDITKDILTSMYISQKMSTVDICTALHVSRRTLTEYMEMFGIKRRSPKCGGRLKSVKLSINDDYFEKIDDFDKAYFLGFLTTDGHLVDRKKSKRLQISIADCDGHILEALADRLGDRSIVKRDVKINCPTRNDGPKACLKVSRTKIVDDLIRNGAILGKHSGIEVFIEQASEELTWAFVRGVFDADGCISRMHAGWRVCFTSGYPLCEGIKQFFESQGIPMSPKCLSPKGVCCSLSVTKRSSLVTILNKMYSAGSIRLERKYARFSQLSDIVQSSDES